MGINWIGLYTIVRREVTRMLRVPIQVFCAHLSWSDDHSAIRQEQTREIARFIAPAEYGEVTVAAVLGIVITMASIAGPIEQIGEKVAAALVGETAERRGVGSLVAQRGRPGAGGPSHRSKL